MKRFGLATRETFASMKVRNFRLFFEGQLVSQVGNWLTLIAQTLLVFELTHSGVALGLLAAAQFGPVLLLGPWAGLVADRSDKRKLLLIVQVIAMAQSFALAALAFSGHPSVLAIYAIAFVGGITIAFDNPARRAFVVEMVPESGITNAVSLNSALMTCARMVGPALAGVLVATVGFGWCFLADALSYIAVIVGLWLIRTGELRPSPVAERAKGQVRAGLRYARSVPELWVPLAMMAVIGTLAYNFQVVFPLFAKYSLGGSVTLFTVLYAATALGSLGGALASARRTSISVRLVAMAAIAFGSMMAVLTIVPTVAVALPVCVLVGMASMTFMTASTAIVQIESAPAMRGRVLALQAMVFLGSTPIGGPIVGWICQVFGPRYGLGVGAAAALGAGVWGMTTVRAARARLDARAPMDATEAAEAVTEAELELAEGVAPVVPA
jgi:MFS family permease